MGNWNQHDSDAEFNRSNYGAYDYRTANSERLAEEQRQRERNEEAWRNAMNQNSGGGSKVICTELVRQGMMSTDDLRLGHRFVAERLSQAHVDGYHAWAVPVVRLMRRSPMTTRFFRVLARARADHIAGHYGCAERGSLLGRVLCAVGEPMCWVIGKLSRRTDYRKLYANKVQSLT